MFKHSARIAALALTLALAGCFGDSTPQEKLAEIETLQAKNLPMTEEQVAQLTTFVTKGKAALAAGQDDAAKTALDGALKILQTAEDAALFNKAD